MMIIKVIILTRKLWTIMKTWIKDNKMYVKSNYFKWETTFLSWYFLYYIRYIYLRTWPNTTDLSSIKSLNMTIDDLINLKTKLSYFYQNSFLSINNVMLLQNNEPFCITVIFDSTFNKLWNSALIIRIGSH